LIYENWFAFVFSLLIIFLFLKNNLLLLPIYFFSLFYTRGSFFQSLFFSFLFAPLVFWVLTDLKIEPIFYFFIYASLFVYIFLSLKKNHQVSFLSILIISFLIFYLNYQAKINLSATILFFIFFIFYFVLVFLRYNLVYSLVIALIFIELAFLIQFLPFSFWVRTIFLLFLLFLFLKYDIIKKLMDLSVNA
jgi:hypothetical protein